MRHELTVFVLVEVSCTMVVFLPFFIVKDDWIHLLMINIPIHFAALFLNLYPFRNLLHQITSTNTPIESTEATSSDQIKLIDILADSTGINEFARFLIGEFSLEHLPFLIEVSQFRAAVDDTISNTHSLETVWGTAGNTVLSQSR